MDYWLTIQVMVLPLGGGSVSDGSMGEDFVAADVALDGASGAALSDVGGAVGNAGGAGEV